MHNLPSLAGPVPLLHDHLLQSARTNPTKVALVCDGARVTYGELDRHSNALANHFAASRVLRGDRVLIFADNTVETVVAFWAALKANAVPSIVNPRTKADKLHYLLQDCRPSAFVSDTALQEVFAQPVADCASVKRIVLRGDGEARPPEQLPQAIRWDDALASASGEAPPRRSCIDVDLAAIIYTSGSTGDPKGVMLTHANMVTACRSTVCYLGIREDEVLLDVLPLAFNYGLYQMIMAFACGAQLVLERSFAFPRQILERMSDERATGFPGVPTMFSILAEMKAPASLDLSSVRFVTNTAAPLTAKHIRALRELFPNARIYSMYGLTECKRCTYLPPEDLERKPGSVGIAIPNTEVWIVDAHGARLPPGEVGELVVRGATVMKGYWEKPEATAQALRPGPLPGESVLHTGDLCRMDEEGYVYFVSRNDDMIKSRGEKVAPKEVETTLMNIAGVKEAAVIGVPDEVLGQAIKAFVVLEAGAQLSEKELQRICQARLESFMVPKHIVIVPGLPRTDTGKIRKIDLS